VIPPTTVVPDADVEDLLKRLVLDDPNDNENDWSDSYWIQLKLSDLPAKKKSPYVLFIIIGVITGVALIITVVLIVTLNRKKQDDYMPVEDLEEDRLLTDTY
jgi:hypothetical protein